MQATVVSGFDVQSVCIIRNGVFQHSESTHLRQGLYFIRCQIDHWNNCQPCMKVGWASSYRPMLADGGPIVMLLSCWFRPRACNMATQLSFDLFSFVIKIGKILKLCCRSPFWLLCLVAQDTGISHWLATIACVHCVGGSTGPCSAMKALITVIIMVAGSWILGPGLVEERGCARGKTNTPL